MAKLCEQTAKTNQKVCRGYENQGLKHAQIATRPDAALSQCFWMKEKEKVLA